jgi:hypothetical protein
MKHEDIINLLSLRSLPSDLAGDGTSQFLLDGVMSSSSSQEVRDGVFKPEINVCK